MNRELRYWVLKLKDVEQYLSTEQEQALRDILQTVSEGRKRDNKSSLACVVVESDWPEYESVWKMIEERVSK